MKQLINTNSTNTLQPLFFGESLGLKRYDNPTHIRIHKFYENQISFFWVPTEVDLNTDKNDFENLPSVDQFIFVENLSYQILLDSIQTRGIQHISQYTSNSELESFCIWWQAFEDMHAKSYTHIINNIFKDPTEVLNRITQNENILKRASSATQFYDNLINEIPDDTLDNLKKKLYLTLVSINILEGIRFYVSFACSYAMAENKKMEGNAKIISLINRDENLHLGFTQYVIKRLRTDEFEGFTHIAKECEDIVYKMYKDAVEEEIAWSEYLFSNGSIMGLNHNLLTDYMKYLTNIRMNAIGLKPFYENIENPLTWMENWIDSKSVQVAPQETEISSYLVGSLDNQIVDDDFDDFEL